MPVRPKTKEFPADHPIHRGLIIFGRKPPSSSELPSSSPQEVSPQEKLVQELASAIPKLIASIKKP